MDRRGLASLAVVLLAAAVVACGPATRATFIPEGGSYTADDLPRLLTDADLSSFSEVPTDEAAEVRTKVLASLRREGADAAALADTLTSEFPPDADSVPAVVERATYEGQPVWIVIESSGAAGETLVHRRLWVFSYNERAVVAAQSAP